MLTISKAAWLSSLCIVQWLVCQSSFSSAQDAPTAHNRTQWPKLREVRWADDSFWGQRQQVCRQSTLPEMTKLMEGTERSHFIENFRIAARMKSGKHRGPDWNDGDTYKWLEALAAAYASAPNAEFKQTMDAAIRTIAAAQRADGYLHTPVLIAEILDPASARPLGDPSQFEMYNFGHLMTAGCVHFDSTGQRELLDVAIRAANFLKEQFARPDSQLARHAICPSHYMGLIDLYRTTHDDQWLQLATHLLNMRDLVQGGDDNQDRVPFREQREAVGHAVRANYLYAGAAELMIETGDRTLWPALEACWSSVQSKKIYITGGCGALFDGASPDGSKKQTSITRIHQAYGRNYQLPNSTAHNETCAAIGHVLWNQRMWQAEHDARYIDALETSLMNAVLAGISLDGERFFYTNTLRQLDTMPTELRWSRERQAWISCYCCPPNVARILASMQRLAYAYDDSSVWVMLYGSNRLQIQLPDGSPVELEQRSGYPHDGRIEIIVQNAPNRALDLRLRIPAWCTSASLTRNGRKETVATEPGSFASLKGTWAKGDRLVLELEMPTRLMAAHPLVEECRGQIAVQRGPLVYCLESSDLPAGVQLANVSISANSEMKLSRPKPDLPNVPILEAELSHSPVSKPANELYSKYEPTNQQAFKANLIPYYAWGNRGQSEMTVWLPVTR